MAGHAPNIEAGIDACERGLADWCQGCGKVRYRRDMRWDGWDYRCRHCLGESMASQAVLPVPSGPRPPRGGGGVVFRTGAQF